MTQKKLICLVSAVFFFCAIKAQETERSILSSAGNISQSSSLEISWTLGETAVPTFSSGNITSCLGMQQGSALDPVSSVLKNELSGISIFPNPTTSLTRVNSESSRNLEYDLFDLFGRRIFSTYTSVSQSSLLIDMQDFPTGNYFLRITDVETQEFTSLKIQKK